MTVDELVREIVREELKTQQPTWNWLTTKQAAELLGITRHRISARVLQGTLPGHKYGGRVYIDRTALDKAIRRARA